MKKPVFIYQIYYNDHTRAQLDADFIPLDNCHSAHPDWFEFWAMKHFLNTHRVDDAAFYGFLSPKFAQKTQISGAQVHQIIQENHSDVYLFTGAAEWQHLAFFRNPFEQAQYTHKYLMDFQDICQQVFNDLAIKINIKDMVCSTERFAFCNYVVARGAYWRAWHRLANALFDYAENSQCPAAQRLRQAAYYRGNTSDYPLKVFVQERLHALLLTTRDWHIVNAATLPTRTAENEMYLNLLHTMNYCKIRYESDGNLTHLGCFEHLRRQIYLFDDVVW